MANVIGELQYKITGDNSKLNSAISQSDKKVSTLSSSVKKFGGILAGAFAVGQVVDFAKRITGFASDLDESINAVNVTFKESSGIIRAFGEESAEAVGLSQTAFNELSTVIGAQLKNSGKPIQDVANDTINLTKRAADLASVFNTEVSEATTALGAALRGETEPARRFGINISQAAIEAEALASGLVNTKSEITEQIKVQARLALIYKQSADVAGDFVNTSDGLANSSRIAAANAAELGATLGKTLLPVATALVGGFNDLVVGLGNLIGAEERQSETLSRTNSTLQARLNILKDQNISEETRKNVIRDVNEVLKDLDLNQVDANTSLEELNRLQKESNDLFLERIRIAAAQELIADKQRDAVKLQKLNIEDQKQLDLDLINIQKNESISIERRIERLQRDIAGRNKKIEVINKEIEEIISLSKIERENTSVLDSNTEALEKNKKTTENASNSTEKLGETAKTASGIIQENFTTAFTNVSNIATTTLSSISSLFSALNSQRQAEFDQEMERVDAETQAKLEAAGLQEETEVERLTREKEEAILAGNEALAAEKERELEKAQILREGEKKKADLQYKAELESWKARKRQIGIEGATAQIRAISAGLQAGFPAAFAIMPILGGIALATTIASLAAANKEKPSKPSFAVGIDNVPNDMDASIHKGEMIVPKPFADAVRDGDITIGSSGGQESGNGIMKRIELIFRSKEEVYKRMLVDSENGLFNISELGVIPV